ncbi:hypothetical protein NY78_0056 [Desulfovibrio sp. TomC]|nr:hypothetical protein NY78_0056 [Desulfovibrio sp. TomC]
MSFPMEHDPAPSSPDDNFFASLSPAPSILFSGADSQC